MASIEDRFKAAVNVIKGLPKNGPYQPSNTMLLKFYGYYKQATEGACTQKKPAFWDIVGRAKWDAWKSNAHLTKHQAMQKYVDNLREIIETMSFTENVADFVGSISGLDNINLDELDMVAPGMREIAQSHPNSPFNSRTNSPQHGSSSNRTSAQDYESPKTSSAAVTLLNTNKAVTANGHHLMKSVNGDHLEDDDDDGDVGVGNDGVGAGVGNDTNPVATAASSALLQTSLMGLRTATSNTATNYAVSTGTVEQSDDEYGDPVDMQHDFTEAMLHNSELLKQVQATILRMNADLLTVKQRLSSMERGVQEVRIAVQHKMTASKPTSRRHRSPEWWPFTNISPQWFVFLLLWPFMFSRISRMFLPQRRK